MITEIVKYSSGSDDAMRVRMLFCRESSATNPPERNPLIETKFNDLLEKIAQEAFDEGRAYERKRPRND